jgi:hypothetical protein
MTRNLSVLFLALLFLPASIARGDDSSAALGAGGIVFTHSADIRMADEDLRISPKEVRIRFVFANDSARDIDMLVAFPLPDIDTGQFSQSPLGTVTDDPVNFVGFAVTADGRPAPVTVEQRAFLNGHDVTAQIHAAGLPLNVVGQAQYKMLEALPKAQRKVLTAEGLADFDEYNNDYPHWIVRTRFFWHQRFPAHRRVVLDEHYQPVTGEFFFGGMSFVKGTDDDARSQTEAYCIDAATRAVLARAIASRLNAAPQSGGYFNGHETDYILKTGNNWKGPIGHFHLVLDKLAPDNVLSLCWDGALVRTGPTTFESTREHFAPQSDIRLLVVDLHAPGG